MSIARLAVSLFLLTSFQGSPSRDQILSAYSAALKRPFDQEILEAYIVTLPRDGRHFVVQGDLLLTRDEIQAYLVALGEQSKAQPNQELLVNEHNGASDFWIDLDSRRLTYTVIRSSFPEDRLYDLVVGNMASAARDWQDACPKCGISFTHVPDDSGGDLERGVTFTVHYHDAKGAYIAAAFFPHDPPVERHLKVDPSYFKTRYDPVGVLRHEIGHILGYRHEHIDGVSGCFSEGGQWIPLTDYDPKSVMHYFCGGGGGLELRISENDKLGHRKLYSPPDSGSQ